MSFAWLSGAGVLAALLLATATTSNAQTATLNVGNGQQVVVPELPPGFLRIEGNVISLDNGLVIFRIPPNWQTNDSPEAHVSIIPSRYVGKLDGPETADCRLIVQNFSVPDQTTQKFVNDRFLSKDSAAVAEARANGTLREFTDTMRLGDAVLKKIVLANPTMYGDHRQFIIAQSGILMSVDANCSISRPEQDQDLSDINDFLNSATLTRPS